MDNLLEIYISDVSSISIDLLNELPEIRKMQIERYIFDEDKKAGIGSFLLLKKALANNNLDISNYEYIVDQKGKPDLKNCPLKSKSHHPLIMNSFTSKL